MNRWPLSVGLSLFSFASFAAGCNAVLDNQSGQLALLDGSADAAIAPSAPGASVDASLGGGGEDTSVPAPPLPDATLPPPVVEAGPSPVDAGTLPVCAFGQKLCDGTCVANGDPRFGCDPSGCAPCALDRATATCAGSGCAVATCNPGYADCDQNAANGCETDLSQSTHCGTCNSKCTTASPDCTPVAGGFTCASGCSSVAPTLCGTQCVDLQTSLDNCGACAAVCPSVTNGQTTCAAGHCGFTCQADFHACGSACASDSSPATCGASCSPCPTGAHAVPTCNGVSCAMACQPSFANCNGVTADGCEVSLLSDPLNCGQCGVSCGGRACNAGTCAAAPPPPPDAGPPALDAGAPAPDAGAPDASPSNPPPDAGEISEGGTG